MVNLAGLLCATLFVDSVSWTVGLELFRLSITEYILLVRRTQESLLTNSWIRAVVIDSKDGFR